MKNYFILLCFSVAFIVVLGSCEKEKEAQQNTAELKSTHSNEVTVPFEANLLGEMISFDTEDAECIAEGYAGRVIVEATGNATHMGLISLTFNFCAGGPPDPNIEGSIMTYTGGTLELLAANGDVLYLSFPGGSVMEGRLDHHPEHVYDYWGGTMSVLGGTGKFMGAHGKLTEDDFSSMLDDYTHHRFYGYITLEKGKRK